MLPSPSHEGTPETTSSTRKIAYRPAADGLRGLMVMAIVVSHLNILPIGRGFVVYDGLFLLSGYLTSATLLHNMRQSGDQVDMYAFYARRVKRLLPAFALVLLLTLVAYRVLTPNEDGQTLQNAFYSATVFLENIYLLRYPAGAELDPLDNPVMHYWFPSVGAQLIMVLPFLFVSMMKSTRHHPATLVGLLVIVQLLQGYQAFVAPTTVPFSLAYSSLFHVHPFLLGTVLTLFLSQFPETRSNRSSRRSIGYVLGFAGVCGLILSFLKGTAFTTSEILGTCSWFLVLASLEANSDTPFAQALSSWLLRAIGKGAWSLYLVHWPIISLSRMMGVAVKEQEGRFEMEMELIVVIAIVSWIVWTLCEGPHIRKFLSSYPPQTILVGTAILLVLLLAVISVGTTIRLGGMETTVTPSSEGHNPNPVQASVTPSPTRTHTPAPSHTPSPSPPPARERTTHFFIGDSSANEWAQSLPVIDMLLKTKFHLLSQSDCPWFPSVNVRCNPSEYWEEVKKYPSPRVIFLLSSEIYLEDLAVSHAGRTISRDDTAWGTFVEKSIRQTLDPFLLDEKEDNVVVILQAHSPRPLALESCIRESPMDECQDIPLRSWASYQQWKRPYETLDAIYQRLDKEYGFRLNYLEMDTLLAPEGTVGALDGPFTIFEDSLYLTTQWCTAHSFDLARKMQPFL